MARAKEFDRDEALAKAPAVDVVKSDTASPAIRWRRHALRRRFRYFKSTSSAAVRPQRRSSEKTEFTNIRHQSETQRLQHFANLGVPDNLNEW